MADDFRKGLKPYVDADGKRRLEREEPICDFCCGDPTENPIKWSYPTGEVKIDLEGSIHASDDDWAACEACHEIIERMPETHFSPDNLILRCIQVQYTRYHPQGMAGFMLAPVTEQVKVVHALRQHLYEWWKARCGPAITEEEYRARQN